MSNPELAQLERAYVDIRAHPHFKGAMYETIARALQHFLRHHTMRRYSKDLASFYAANFTVFLNVSERGLTAGSFADACVQTALCSKGRAATLLAYMRARGDVAVEQGSEGRRMRKLVPSETMLDFCADRMADQIRGCALISPMAEAVLPRLADRDFRIAVLAGTGDIMLQHNGLHGQTSETSALNFFGRRNAGLNILFSLFAPHPDKPLAGTPFEISVSGLASNLGVSRPHVLKLLRDGDAEKYLQWNEAERKVVFSAELAEALEAMYALVFLIGQIGLMRALSQTSG